MTDTPLRFGVFLGPHHPTDENPTLCLTRDLDLLQHLDALDYDEAWIGEHHSGGFEIVAAPEIFLATAAERTKHIKLGTGVKTVSFYHPLVVADQMVLLDHLTRGRVMFGAGPGALPSDAYMMGIEPGEQRQRMTDALDAIVPLMEGETVSMETDWFTLKDAKLQLASYTKPMMEMAVTSVRSPAGALCAGKYGAGLLVLGGTSDEALATQKENWRICEETAAKHNRTVERRQWRITMMIHIAETKEKAMKDMEFGLQKWIDYSHHVLPASRFPEDQDPLKWGMENNALLIGTPDDMIEEIERVQKHTGGFGTLLFYANNFANWEATKHSYELVARHVFPHFKGSNTPRLESYGRARKIHDQIKEDFKQAVDQSKDAYQKSK
ncbi:MAG: LLM class flavin-dependent oxidoreductase [Rhodospirillales bacterium]|jgi:limonene 1,2-monooxygenase